MEVAATEVIEIGTESHQEEQGTSMDLQSRQSGWSELRTCQAELVGRYVSGVVVSLYSIANPIQIGKCF